MDPILISIGPLAIRWYGLLIALGVVAGSIWALREARRREMNTEALLDMAPWLMIAGILGARAVFVATSPGPFFGPGGNPWSALAIWQGGLSIHGAILGVMLAVLLLARRRGMRPWAVMDVLTPLGAFGIIGGRIGNVMNGTDTGGRLTELGIGVTWPEPGTETLGAFGRVVFGPELWQYGPPACQTVPAGEACVVHLTPIYGAVVGVLLIPILAWAFRRSTAPGFVFAHLAVWYSLLRSVLEEPFRDNPLAWPVFEHATAGIGLFTLTQLVSIPIVLIAVYALFTLDPDRDDRKGRLARRAANRR
ncbi:MAG: prolipoprotein diacylglyceryl transferase [Trueperaceae bacterium]|nr:prolipoprotein diacylglyceryl transferase [Trueperaceae bacterium]